VRRLATLAGNAFPGFFIGRGHIPAFVRSLFAVCHVLHRCRQLGGPAPVVTARHSIKFFGPIRI
jgi:hypothetical protein